MQTTENKDLTSEMDFDQLIEIETLIDDLVEYLNGLSFQSTAPREVIEKMGHVEEMVKKIQLVALLNIRE